MSRLQKNRLFSDVGTCVMSTGQEFLKERDHFEDLDDIPNSEVPFLMYSASLKAL
jgi:hypothetical protein